MHLALDKGTNDLILGGSGGVERVSEGRFIVQQVQSKLKTWLGEWALDPAIGWVNASDFRKNYDLYDLEDRARSIILNTTGVLSIELMRLTYNQRKLEVYFEAMTIHGTINLTVPWE